MNITAKTIRGADSDGSAPRSWGLMINLWFKSYWCPHECLFLTLLQPGRTWMCDSLTPCISTHRTTMPNRWFAQDVSPMARFCDVSDVSRVFVRSKLQLKLCIFKKIFKKISENVIWDFFPFNWTKLQCFSSSLHSNSFLISETLCTYCF